MKPCSETVFHLWSLVEHFVPDWPVNVLNINMLEMFYVLFPEDYRQCGFNPTLPYSEHQPEVELKSIFGFIYSSV